MRPKYVGATPIRKEGVSKVVGQAMYVDDLIYKDMLHGATIRSQVAAGTLIDIKFHDGVNWDEFTIVRAEDIPGENVIAFHIDDQPCLVAKEIRHREEPVVLIAHSDPDELRKAKGLVELVVDEKKATLSLEDGLRCDQPVWGKDNIIKNIVIDKGNIENVETSSLVEVTGEYRTSAQEQMYIEPQGMIAQMDGDIVQVEGSLQCPYYVHTALKKLFAKGDDKIRVIQTETGGAFGGKEEYPSMIAAHATLLSWKSGKPVKLIYDRAEDLAATTKRHPSKTNIKSYWTKEGVLKSLKIDFDIDAGAYATVSPVVLSRGALHAAGPYVCENIRINCNAVATNYPPYGAFRGFGAPQSIFAMERHVYEASKVLGIDDVQLRKINLLKTGGISSTSQVIKDEVDFEGLIDKVLSSSEYQNKKNKFKKWNAENSKIKKGIGVASFYHGAGFTGAGEKYLKAIAGVDFIKGEGVRILTASTEMGQGKNTIFTQIVADALGISYENVSVAKPDTFVVPDSGPTVASRTAMIVGWLIEKAASDMVKILQKDAGLSQNYSDQDFLEACELYLENNDKLECFSQYEIPGHVVWDEKKYKGDAYAAYGWACYVAEVSVDMMTYEARVENFYAGQDIGKVLHPLLCAGQIEGGVTQGIGYALMEDVVWKEGTMANNRMTNYIIPTSADMPEIKVIFTESPTPIGPGGGAKGVGELPMDGPAPAVANAIEDALGLAVNTIPATPERLAKIITGEKNG